MLFNNVIKNKFASKIIATILVIILTGTNVFLLGEYITNIYATGDLEEQEITTQTENIEFDAYFVANQNKTHSISKNIGDIETISLNLKLKNEGYLKNASISFENTNFNIEESIKKTENIEEINITDKIIKLNQIEKNADINIEVPFTKEQSKIFNLKDFNKESNVVLRGTYINNKGKEINIEKTIRIKISWFGTAKLELKADIVKYVTYEENKTMIQYLVEANKIGNLPIKQTSIDVFLPSINEIKPTEIRATALSTFMTNGKQGDSSEFQIKNWNYDSVNNSVNIKVENEANDDLVTNYNNSDKYLVTVIYENLEKTDKLNIESKVSGKLLVYNNTEIKEVTSEDVIIEKELIKNFGEALEKKISTRTSELFKGKLYANTVNAQYELEYISEINTFVGFANAVDNITIKTEKDLFVDKEEKTYLAATYIKKIAITQINFERILGKDGFVEVYNLKSELLGKMDINNLEFNFGDNLAEEIIIKTSAPLIEGYFNISITKALKSEQPYKLEQLKSFIKIAQVMEKSKVEIILNETITSIDFNMNKEMLTVGNNENVQIGMILNTNSDKYDLYKNPVFKIEFPSFVESINVKGYKIVFENGLVYNDGKRNISVNDQGNLVLTVALDGIQSQISIQEIQGTQFILNTDIVVKAQENTTTSDIQLKENVKMFSINENAVTYENEVEQKEVVLFVPYVAPVVQEEIIGTEETNVNTALNAQLQNLDAKLECSFDEGVIIRAGQVIEYTVNIKNKGTENIKNLVAKYSVPEGLNYTKFEVDENNFNVYNEYPLERDVLINIPEIASNETFKYTILVKPIELLDTETQKTVTSKINISNDNFVTSFETNEVVNNIEKASFHLSINDLIDSELFENQTSQFSIDLNNISEDTLNNVILEFKIPDQMEYISTILLTKEGNATYDASTKIMRYTLAQFDKNKFVPILVNFKTKTLSTNTIVEEVKMNINVVADNIGVHTSEEFKINIFKSKYDFKLTSSNAEVVKENDIIEYKFKVENNSTVELENLLISMDVPKNTEFITMEPFHDEVVNGKLNWQINVMPNQSSEIIVRVRVLKPADTSIDTKIENSFFIEADFIAKTESNKTIHIIEAKTNIVTDKYKISGTIWNDSNENGEIENTEGSIKNVVVTLKNSLTNQEIATTTTNDVGQYTFGNIDKGEYIVVFKYNKDEYELAKNINSLVVENQNGALSNVIKITDSNIYNINLGLVNKQKFDLKLDKYISKVSVSNSNGTKTTNYSNAKLTKTDINKKYLSGSNISIEYKIVVKNNGNVAGYAKKIVDYLPKDMNFDKHINPDWNQDESGNLYNTKLDNILLQPGEEKEIKIILTKIMTEDNTGITMNIAEIAEDFNELGLKDINSTPGNRVQQENDISIAEVIITLSTGSVLIYVILILSITSLIGGGIYLINKKVLKKI